MKLLLKYKWIAVVLSVVFMIVLDSMVFNVSISRRGVAIGLGVDMEGDQLVLTAQVVLPKNGGVSSGGNNYINYSATADDLDKCMDIIGAESGLELSIAHTTIIVVGKALIENKRFDIFEYFLSDDKVNDNVLIAMAEDKAIDILKAKVPIGGVASYQLSSQLKPAKPPLGLVTVNLKDFASRMYMGKGENYLPVVNVEKIDPSSDQSKDKVEEADAFKLDKTAIMDKDGLKGELDVDATEGLTMIKKDIQDGVIQIEDIDNRKISVNIASSKASISYDYESKLYEVKLDMKVSRSEGRYEDNTFGYNMTNKEIIELQNAVIKRIQAVLDYSLEIGVDILGIKEGFYRSNPKYRSDIMNDDFLEQVKLHVEFIIIQR